MKVDNIREIKFRGKDVKGSWIYGYPIIVSHKAWIKDINDTTTNPRRLGQDSADFRCVEVEEETVGQYTGLKDKSGVEVYEGDILTLENGNVIGAVRFNERICSFELCDEKSGDSYWLLQDPSLKYEIIGNIYVIQNTKGGQE